MLYFYKYCNTFRKRQVDFLFVSLEQREENELVSFLSLNSHRQWADLHYTILTIELPNIVYDEVLDLPEANNSHHRQAHNIIYFIIS